MTETQATILARMAAGNTLTHSMISNRLWSLLKDPFTVTGYEERQARTMLSKPMVLGLLASWSDRGPVRLGFPIEVVGRWLPRFYPGLG